MHIYICLENVPRIFHYLKNMQTEKRTETDWHGVLKKRMLRKKRKKNGWQVMRENIMSKKLINTPEPGITQDKSEIYKANIIKSIVPDNCILLLSSKIPSICQRHFPILRKHQKSFPLVSIKFFVNVGISRSISFHHLFF